MSDLSDFVVSEQPELLDIKVYYTFKKSATTGVKRVTVLDEEKGKQMLEAKDPDIKVLSTKWKFASWKDQNKILESTTVVSPDTGMVRLNYITYRAARVKVFLVDWDMEHEGKKIPVKSEFIDKLPENIVLNFFDQYEKLTGLDAEATKKS